MPCLVGHFQVLLDCGGDDAEWNKAFCSGASARKERRRSSECICSLAVCSVLYTTCDTRCKDSILPRRRQRRADQTETAMCTTTHIGMRKNFLFPGLYNKQAREKPSKTPEGIYPCLEFTTAVSAGGGLLILNGRPLLTTHTRKMPPNSCVTEFCCFLPLHSFVVSPHVELRCREFSGSKNRFFANLRRRP